MRIDPRAIVDPSVNLAEDAVVGPFSIIEAGVTIGANTVIGSHVVVESGTTIGVRLPHRQRRQTGRRSPRREL